MLIGDKIKQLRKEAKMTQPDLAQKIGVTRSAIATYENNTRQPSFQVLIRISNIFNVSTDYLLLDSETDTLDIGGLTVEQRMLVVDLVKNFKETNEFIQLNSKSKTITVKHQNNQ